MSEKSDEESKRKRSRSPRSRSSEQPRYGGKVGRDTNSNDKDALRRRVFVGNLSTDKTTKAEIEGMFGKFGSLESVSLHHNFGFVQFQLDKDADAAVLEMHGKTLFGKRVDVNLAGMRRKTQNKDRFESAPRKEEVVPENMRSTGRFSPQGKPRSRSPIRHGPPGGRSLSPMSRYEELYRKDDPYARPMERPGRDPYVAPYDPAARDFHARGDYFNRRTEPYPPRYERDYPPPRDDPYLRGGYDGYGPPQPRRPLRPAIDAEIVALSKEESRYAEEVEGRLRSIGLVCNIGYPAPELPVLEVIDRIAHAGTLYAVVVSAQNAQHRSCTLNILHGTRQEHRNMPLNDALSFVARNFDSYLRVLRDPYGGAPPPVSAYGARDDPRGYPQHRPPPTGAPAGATVASVTEKQMSNQELSVMIEKLRREKEQREAGGAPASEVSQYPPHSVTSASNGNPDQSYYSQQQSQQPLYR